MTEANSLLYIDTLQEEYLTRNLYIHTFTVDDLDVDPERCGLRGSPTKVHKVESVVLAGNEQAKIDPTKDGLRGLVDKLMDDHIFG